MNKKLPKHILEKLRELEPKLQRASKYGQFNEAERIIKIIQKLFVNNRDHHRILQAKNWFFQAAFEDNRIDYAIQGFETIRIRANENTRIYLEATVLLGMCYLRKREIELSKKYIREAVISINNIRSDERRNQFQKRIIDRIESESILAFIASDTAPPLDQQKLHKDAIKLIQTKTETQIYEEVGSSIPKDVFNIINGIKDYSVKLLPSRDQKLLYPAKTTISNVTFGKKVLNSVKRICWRSVCDPDSQIYKLWKNWIPEIYSKGYFVSAVAATYAKFSIGFPVLAIGLVAVLMRYSAREFCENYSPRNIMIDIKEKG